MKLKRFESHAVIGLLVLASLNGAAMGASWRDYRKKPNEWFASRDALTVAKNVLSWQTPRGDWPKNLDTMSKPYRGDRKKLRGTFDNGATTGELRFLARAFVATKNRDCRAAFIKGLDHILAAQYPTGGWPQTSPPGRGYPRHMGSFKGINRGKPGIPKKIESPKPKTLNPPGLARY